MLGFGVEPLASVMLPDNYFVGREKSQRRGIAPTAHPVPGWFGNVVGLAEFSNRQTALGRPRESHWSRLVICRDEAGH